MESKLIVLGDGNQDPSSGGGADLNLSKIELYDPREIPSEWGYTPAHRGYLQTGGSSSFKAST